MSTPSQTLVHSYLFLRRAIGFIGILLPFALIIGKEIADGGGLIGSLSGYYYTDLRDVLVGTMCAAGIFLLSYHGHNRLDDLMTTVAAAGAIGLALFPTSPAAPTTWEKIVGILHLVFAALFFLAIAYVCLWLFTRRDGEQPEGRKDLRNVLYRVCGVVIVVCLVLIALAKSLGLAGSLYPALWLESVAVWAFGLAWLVKGQTLLRN